MWGNEHTLTASVGVSIRDYVRVESVMSMLLWSIWVIKVFTPHSLVMCWGVMFAEVVCSVEGAWGPVHIKLILANAVTDPVVAHIHSFAPFLFD